jgi:hypothetical protein
MNRSNRDPIRIIETWLDEGVATLPDRVLDAVLDDLPATPQRRPSWLARRSLSMNNTARIGLGVAAVVTVAVIAVSQLPGLLPPGGETTPSPSVAASATPTPAPVFPADGELTMGRYSMTRSGVQLSIDVPASGWSSSSGYSISKGTTPSQANLIFWTDAPDNVYSDPCTKTRLSPPSGTTAPELAASVAAVPGTELVEGPLPVTIGGRPAQHVVLRIPNDLGCSAANEFFLWYDEAIGGRTPSEIGATIHVWVIDVDGVLVWIDGEILQGTASELELEMQEIIDSIVFE